MQPETVQRVFRGHAIHMATYGHDADHLVRLIQETWAQMPLSARRQMLAFWRTFTPAGKFNSLSLPRFEFYTAQDAFLGRVEAMGGIVTFEAASIPLMSDDAVRYLIAHELAHVHQWATGLMQEWHDLGRRTQDERGMESCIEEQADDIAEAWGFDGQALAKWKKQHNTAQEGSVL